MAKAQIQSSKSYRFPQVRISRAALEHLEKLLPDLRKAKGYHVTKTAAASEAILAIRVPSKRTARQQPQPCDDQQ